MAIFFAVNYNEIDLVKWGMWSKVCLNVRICRLPGLGEKNVAQPDKDDFNLEDFQYSGVKLTPVPDFTQEASAPDLLASQKADASASSSELVSPLEPEEKKAKKKAKKVKPVKVKKAVALADASADARTQSPILKQLSEASPYTVLLGVTVLALLLAVIFLFIELSRYDFNTKAIVMNESIRAPFDRSGMAEIERGPGRVSDFA